MSLTCRVQITINEIPEERARAVLGALEPDNVDFPKGLTMEMEDLGGRLVFHFTGRRMETLASTIDEVLQHIQVALKVTES